MDPTHLRERAGAMRHLATRLERSSVHSLDRLAGPETWRGPAADAFLEQLGVYRARLADAAHELRWQATLLCRQADDLDADRSAAAAGVAP